MGWGWGQSGSCRRRWKEAASSGQECAPILGRVELCLCTLCTHNVPQHLAQQSGLFPHLIPAPCDRMAPSGSFAKEEISHGFGFAGKAWKSTDTAPDIVRSFRNNNRLGLWRRGGICPWKGS